MNNVSIIYIVISDLSQEKGYISVMLTVRSCTICVVFSYMFFCEPRRRKVLNVGGRGAGGGRGARFRILGGGAREGANFAGCKLIGAPNQCQIITFLTLKYDDIAKLRIELKSILLEKPSNKRNIY